MFHPGLCSVTFRELAPERIIDIAAEAGLEGIEWGSDVHLPPDDLAKARDLRDRTLAASLVLPSYGSYYRLGEVEPHPFERYLQTALELGTPTIRIWPGRGASAEIDADRRRQLVDDAKRIADLAAAHELTVATEFHSHSLTDTPESACQLMREVDRPNFQSYWQTTPGADAESGLASLRLIKPWLVNIHCFHWLDAPRDQRPLAEATDAWRRYLTEAGTVDHDIWVLLEFVRSAAPEQLGADAAALRGLLG